ncbi:hypothetical protein MJA45_27325 [Paenibacillus aurantius]|uniref:DUF4363 domain-containing protein n=1 Tax=Paenibacillus aurantius TaxID=2918900 RepID=A0AA96LFX2_9BACL|nr:hypothetical protein [Paenibacillus aurantius]WJH35975.1 hypothetical protein N6H14_08785 [Paenibacillus sp. CC-CFT747]WNQ11266.1 hypothetical protein MJA45_27325 [Paenibacillus aurantius]
MKLAKVFLSLMAVVLVLAACSSKSGSTKDGAKKMQDTLVQMQKNVDAGDTAQIKKNAEELEETWEGFEDDVKKNQADVYGKVEDPLGAIQTGAKQSKPDPAVMKDQITKLNEALKLVK